MEMSDALDAFGSLSQETRLRVFRLLIEYGREGAPAGKIAEELEIPDNTLSFHLSHMSKAKLVHSRRTGRTITYFADGDLIQRLIEFLQRNCCARETKAKSKCGPRQNGRERSC